MDNSQGMQTACCPVDSAIILKYISKREAKDLPVLNALHQQQVSTSAEKLCP